MTRMLLALLAMMILSLARADDLIFQSDRSNAALLELYSSEGCSSCPPAEDWVNALKTSPALWKDIFPMVFHVDYWDGLGWPDRFARAEFTQRQRGISARLGQDSVYTPEFVADGLEWRRSYFDSERLPAAARPKAGRLVLTVSPGGEKISAVFTPGDKTPPPTINVATLGFGLVTDVKRGENSGRNLRHDFVVLGFVTKPLAEANSAYQLAPTEIKSNTGDSPGAIVAWVSATDGSIAQIAGGWLKSQP